MSKKKNIEKPVDSLAYKIEKADGDSGSVKLTDEQTGNVTIMPVEIFVKWMIELEALKPPGAEEIVLQVQLNEDEDINAVTKKFEDVLGKKFKRSRK